MQVLRPGGSARDLKATGTSWNFVTHDQEEALADQAGDAARTIRADWYTRGNLHSPPLALWRSLSLRRISYPHSVADMETEVGYFDVAPSTGCP